MYLYGWNLPGCLPEMDPITCETFEEAKNGLLDEIARSETDAYINDEHDEGAAWKDLWHEVTTWEDTCSADAPDGYVYWITEADETEPTCDVCDRPEFAVDFWCGNCGCCREHCQHHVGCPPRYEWFVMTDEHLDNPTVQVFEDHDDAYTRFLDLRAARVETARSHVRMGRLTYDDWEFQPQDEPDESLIVALRDVLLAAEDEHEDGGLQPCETCGWHPADRTGSPQTGLPTW